MQKFKLRNIICFIIVLVIIIATFGCYYKTNAEETNQNNNNEERFSVIYVQNMDTEEKNDAHIRIIIDNETNVKYLYVCRDRSTHDGSAIGIGVGLCKLEDN